MPGAPRMVDGSKAVGVDSDVASPEISLENKTAKVAGPLALCRSFRSN
jgi:hypothetical protein